MTLMTMFQSMTKCIRSSLNGYRFFCGLTSKHSPMVTAGMSWYFSFLLSLADSHRSMVVNPPMYVCTSLFALEIKNQNPEMTSKVPISH